MEWNEYTGSMSIDELNLLTREGFVGKVALHKLQPPPVTGFQFAIAFDLRRG